MRLPAPNTILSGLLLLTALAACSAPVTVQTKPLVKLQDCPRLAIFEDETTLAIGLPALYREHMRDLIVIETAVYLNTCDQEHLAGAAEASRVNGTAEASKVASAGERSKVGTASEASMVGDAGEASRIAAASEASKINDAIERARLAAASENSRNTGVGMSSRVSSAGELSKIGGVAENSKIAGAGETSKVASTSSTCQCSKGSTDLGYQLIGIPPGRRVRIFDGVELRKYVDGKTVD